MKPDQIKPRKSYIGHDGHEYVVYEVVRKRVKFVRKPPAAASGDWPLKDFAAQMKTEMRKMSSL